LARAGAATLALLAALALTASGCGEEAGVSDGATVRVYVSVPLSGPQATAGRQSCAAARRALEQSGGRAGDLEVRAICLDSAAGGRGAWNLAAVGANARQAVEDSTTVAYLGEQDPSATRFSAPILEAAEIAQLPAASAVSSSSSMKRVLESIAKNPETPRESTFESASGS
jgi:ABC-type branched-subunit amino acid transport system substrate-binding protein